MFEAMLNRNEKFNKWCAPLFIMINLMDNVFNFLSLKIEMQHHLKKIVGEVSS